MGPPPGRPHPCRLYGRPGLDRRGKRPVAGHAGPPEFRHQRQLASQRDDLLHADRLVRRGPRDVRHPSGQGTDGTGRDAGPHALAGVSARRHRRHPDDRQRLFRHQESHDHQLHRRSSGCHPGHRGHDHGHPARGCGACGAVRQGNEGPGHHRGRGPRRGQFRLRRYGNPELHAVRQERARRPLDHDHRLLHRQQPDVPVRCGFEHLRGRE